MGVFRAIKILWLSLFFGWKYRKLLWLAMSEVDDVFVQVKAAMVAYNRGKDGGAEARLATQKLLSLKSFSEYVGLTESIKDEEALANVREFVDDDEIWSVAWRILQGDWNVSIESTRWQSFMERIRRALPFVNANKAEKAVAKSKADPLSEEAEIGVIEVISIVSLILTVLPKIANIIKKRKENREK